MCHMHMVMWMCSILPKREITSSKRLYDFPIKLNYTLTPPLGSVTLIINQPCETVTYLARNKFPKLQQCSHKCLILVR